MLKTNVIIDLTNWMDVVFHVDIPIVMAHILVNTQAVEKELLFNM